MHERNLTHILLVIVILCALGEGYLLFQNMQLRAAFSASATMPSPSSGSQAPAPAEAPTNILIPLGGIVQSVSGNTIVLQGQASSTVKVVVPSGTPIVQEGPLKDAATYQSDIEKFHQESDQLMQNPQANQAALQTLIAPSRSVETPIMLSQISPGENVTVFSVGQNADGTYQAFRIEVMPRQ